MVGIGFCFACAASFHLQKNFSLSHFKNWPEVSPASHIEKKVAFYFVGPTENLDYGNI